MHPDWLIPQWPVASRVRSVCTTRQGGVSMPPWDSLNLGDHVGDDGMRVQANRDALAQACGVPVTYLQQVHGVHMHLLEGAPSVMTVHAPTVADGVYCAQSGLACCVMVADCLPILLTNRAATLVAAVHAGWRGLAGQGGVGVVEAITRTFADHAQELGLGGGDASVLAWLGPCIGPQAFEVGEEVRAAFMQYHPQAEPCFAQIKPTKWLADLPQLARQRLASCGVQQVFGNDGGANWCTYTQRSRFFSHRRDRVSGRQAALVWLE